MYLLEVVLLAVTASTVSADGFDYEEVQCEQQECEDSLLGVRKVSQYLLLAVIYLITTLIVLICLRSLFLAFYQNFILDTSKQQPQQNHHQHISPISNSSLPS